MFPRINKQPKRGDDDETIRWYRSALIYPYHPQAGEQLPVIECRQYGGDEHYVIRSSGGGKIYLPAWMTKPEAANHELVTMPRIAIGALRALRRILDEKPTLLHGRTGHDQLTGGEEDEASTESPAGSVSRRRDGAGSAKSRRARTGKGTVGRAPYSGAKRRSGGKGEGA